MKETSHFYREMEKLEKQQSELHDQYNQENEEFNVHEYVRKLIQGSTLPYSLAANEPIIKYYDRLKLHIDLAQSKNINTHVKNNGRGCWFTHMDKFGVGCFMCEDLNLISYESSIIGYFANKYPTTTIKQITT